MKRLLLLGGGMLALSACTISPGYGDRPAPVIVQSQAPRDHVILQAPQPQPVIMRDAYDDLDIRVPGIRFGERRRWNNGYRNRWDYGDRRWNNSYRHRQWSEDRRFDRYGDR